MLQIKRSELKQLAQNKLGDDSNESQNKILVMISTSLAARTSYTVVGDEKEVDYQKMIKLHDRLITADPIHASPMEHCARVMTDYEYERNIKGEIIISDDGKITIPDDVKGWCRNYRGFIQYRHLIENETV